MILVDTHAHLDMKHFDKDREAVIARASAAGVTTIVTQGVDIGSSKKAIELAEKHEGIFATVGFHPSEASKFKDGDINVIAKLANQPKVVAIGELGLDYYRDYSPRDTQKKVLESHLELASKLKLPVIIHCRQAETDMLPMLHNWRTRQPSERPGVIHCFSGDMSALKQYVEMGFFVSQGGYVSYPSTRPNYDIIRAIPEDRLLVETDCPFLPPQKYRGQRNEPAYVVLTVQALAEIRGTSPEVIAERTTANARRLFNLA